MDHPFRWSDDLNRALLFLLVFFAPGRFVGVAIAGLGRLGWQAWHASDKEWNATRHDSDADER